jgi:hypothetical protein
MYVCMYVLLLLLFTAIRFAPGGSSPTYPSTDKDDKVTLYNNN